MSSESRLRAHVEALAGIGERHIWRPGALERAADSIRLTLAGIGYLPGAQPFDVRGARVQNIEAIAAVLEALSAS